MDNGDAQMRLVQQAKQGDRDAFMALVRPELPRLHQAAYYLARGADEAQDLAQMACLRAFSAIATFRPEASMGPWLHRILRNVYLDRRKSASARHEVRMVPEAGDGVAALAEDVSPLEHVLSRERQAALTEHIRALPPTFAEILVLCDIQGFSHAEVCELAELPVGTVKSRLSRARTMLRDRLLAARELSGPPPRKHKRGHS